jgi:hypothetical protein
MALHLGIPRTCSSSPDQSLDDGSFAECRRGKLMSDHTREVLWRATSALSGRN